MDTRDLLQRIDLRAMAESAGATFKGFNGNSSPCPLHKGNNPTAFHIYRGEDGIMRWHCFTGCRTGGDAIKFYMTWQKVDFLTAVKELESWAANPSLIATATTAAPPAPIDRRAPSQQWQDRCQQFLRYCQDELWDNLDAVSYLTSYRGLSNETIGSWGLGYNPRDIWDNEAQYGLADGKRLWLPQGFVIPGWRNDGLWYVKIRRPIGSEFVDYHLLPDRPDSITKMKYAAVRGGVQTIFGETHLHRRHHLVLVEGEFDTMLLQQECGNLVDVITLGGAAGRFTTDDLMILASYERIIAAHDNDTAGDRARQLLAGLSSRIIEWPPLGKDITAMFQSHGGEFTRRWIDGALAAPRNGVHIPTTTIVIERLDLNGDGGWQRVDNER